MTKKPQQLVWKYLTESEWRVVDAALASHQRTCTNSDADAITNVIVKSIRSSLKSQDITSIVERTKVAIQKVSRKTVQDG